MVRIAVFLAAVIGFAAPLTALQAGRDKPQDIIKIEVAPEDLERCKATLAQVLQPPAGSSELVAVDAPALPTAVCVPKTA